jgi:hypothetical protein
VQAACDYLLGFDPLAYDGSLFRVFEGYRDERLDAARRLRRMIGDSAALGDLLTGDLISKGEATDRRLELRSPTQTYPPLYLAFTDHPEWVAPTDHLLRTFKRALENRPKIYRAWIESTRCQPMGGVFELNVFGLLNVAFPPVEAQPRLPNTRKRADFAVSVREWRIFIEAAVLGEPRWETETRVRMLRDGRSTWGGAVPGPDEEARRIASKVEEELMQTASDLPNVICLSFFDHSPSELARRWFFEDLFGGGARYRSRRDGTELDLTNVDRVDAFALFGRDPLVEVVRNPLVARSLRLPDDVSREVGAALSAHKLMIR